MSASSETMTGGTTSGPFACGSARKGRHGGGRANWSGLNIAVMVGGFVFFWPLGLVFLWWNLSGRDVREFPGAVRRQWQSMRGGRGMAFAGGSGNLAFEAFQQTQYDRIAEIREEIEQRARRFRVFRTDAQRRADEEEFARFMASAPDRPEA